MKGTQARPVPPAGTKRLFGKGYWTCGWFFDADGTLKPNREPVRASSKENLFLPPDFYYIIAAEYTPGATLARQELEGEFVDLVGLLFQYAWFNLCSADDVPKTAQRVRYWDKAGSEGRGDYSAGLLMARDTDGGSGLRTWCEGNGRQPNATRSCSQRPGPTP